MNKAKIIHKIASYDIYEDRRAIFCPYYILNEEGQKIASYSWFDEAIVDACLKAISKQYNCFDKDKTVIKENWPEDDWMGINDNQDLNIMYTESYSGVRYVINLHDVVDGQTQASTWKTIFEEVSA